MVEFIAALILVLLTVTQMASIVTGSKQHHVLRSRLRTAEIKVAELEQIVSRQDRLLKEAQFLHRKGGPFKPYTYLAGDLSLHANGKTALVKATFRPDTYA
jgi:hypothetical protein